MAEINVSNRTEQKNEQQDEKIQELEDRLDRLERGQKQQSMGMVEMLDRLVPGDVRQHLRAARREQLLAVRAFLDNMINRLDEADTKSGRRRRVEVE